MDEDMDDNRIASDKLNEFKAEFLDDYSSYDQNDVFNFFEERYKGSSSTLANVNSKSNQPIKETNVVRNFTSELIEAKVDTSIPTVAVKSRRESMAGQAKMIQGKILSDIDSMPFYGMTDINERNTYMHGIACTIMNWNLNKGSRDALGEKEIVNVHPKNIIPQARIYNIEEMDHVHTLAARTKQDIFKEYGIYPVSNGEQYPQAASTNTNVSTNVNGLEVASTASDLNKDIVTQITRFYYDEDGDVGKFSWVNDEILVDLPKYYYPRVSECTKCGAENEQGTEECYKCGKKKFKTKMITQITTEEDMTLTPLVYTYKRKIVIRDDNGVPIDVEEKEEKIVTERIVPAGTKIDIPVPKYFPVGIRKNVPLNFMFRGRSDVALISDLQESHKKIYHRREEKILNSSGIIFLDNQMHEEISNDVYRVIRGTPSQIEGAKKFETQSPIQDDTMLADKLYADAASTLNVTSSFQGKYDPSAKSGKAKELQINQTKSILMSAAQNKLNYYERLFELMFWFDLNFTQESRPYYNERGYSATEYSEYNKYELLMKDKSGEWYFNTDFTFKAVKSSEIPNDKEYIYQQVQVLLNAGMLTPIQAWEVLATIDFPMAKEILEDLQVDPTSEIAAKVLGTLSAMGPDDLINFIQNVPPEKQVQILTESMQEGGPQNV